MTFSPFQHKQLCLGHQIQLVKKDSINTVDT